MNSRFFTLIVIPLIIMWSEAISQTSTDSTMNVIVIDAQNASLRNYRDLGDMLHLIPGMWNRDLGSTGLISSVRFRGNQSGHTLLLLDGEILTDPWSGQSDFSLIPAEMIERIEIYPTLNPFGIISGSVVINIVSKQKKGRPYSKFFYRSGSNGYSDLDVALHESISSRIHIASGALIKKYAADITDETYEAHKLRARISWQLLKNTTLYYQILYNKSDKDLPYTFIIPGDSVSFDSPHIKTMRFDHRLRTESELFGIKTTFSLNYTALNYDIHAHNFSPRLEYPVSRLALSIQQSKSYSRTLFRWGLRTWKRQVEAPGATKFTDYLHQAYIQSRFPLLRKIFSSLQASVQSSPDGRVHFLGAAQLERQIKIGQIHAAFSQGLYNPSIGEKYGMPFYPHVPVTFDQSNYWHYYGAQILPNPDLKSEKTNQVELSFNLNPLYWIQSNLSLYTLSVDETITWINTENGGQFQNSGRYRNSGVETDLRIGPFYGLSTVLVFNYLYSEDAQNQSLLERPNIWGNAALLWIHDFFKKDLRVKCCFAARYHSETWGLNASSATPALIYINPATFLDLKLIFVVMRQFQIIYEIDNLLDYNNTLVPGFPPTRRNTRFGFQWDLFD